ncbi:MAG: hypothetical protein U5R06_18195 [candidate division KSB1 bacterium]|nr:hypothetical protein [candidate division KSB1 bacterium]
MMRAVFIVLTGLTLNGFAFAGSSDSLSIQQHQDRWFALDKAHHFTTSAVLTGLGYYAARQEAGFDNRFAAGAAAGVSISLGIGKECYDHKFSYKDLFADILGIAAGLFIINVTME